MELSKRDGNIKPGIYRRSLFSRMNGIPGILNAEYENQSVENILKNILKDDMVLQGYSKIVDGNEEISKNNYWPKRTFFKSIDDFLKTLIRGYKLGVSQFGHNQIENELGFELFYVNWKPDSEFYRIGSHEGLRGGNNPFLINNSIIILGDNNGMNDKSGFLNFGVNDFRNEKVLVFKYVDDDGFREYDREENYFGPENKLLRDNLYYYSSGRCDGEEFPFKSPNILKSTQNHWTLIGIPPHEVCAAVERIGFQFPN